MKHAVAAGNATSAAQVQQQQQLPVQSHLYQRNNHPDGSNVDDFVVRQEQQQQQQQQFEHNISDDAKSAPVKSPAMSRLLAVDSENYMLRKGAGSAPEQPALQQQQQNAHKPSYNGGACVVKPCPTGAPTVSIVQVSTSSSSGNNVQSSAGGGNGVFCSPVLPPKQLPIAGKLPPPQQQPSSSTVVGNGVVAARKDDDSLSPGGEQSNGAIRKSSGRSGCGTRLTSIQRLLCWCDLDSEERTSLLANGNARSHACHGVSYNNNINNNSSSHNHNNHNQGYNNNEYKAGGACANNQGVDVPDNKVPPETTTKVLVRYAAPDGGRLRRNVNNDVNDVDDDDDDDVADAATCIKSHPRAVVDEWAQFGLRCVCMSGTACFPECHACFHNVCVPWAGTRPCQWSSKGHARPGQVYDKEKVSTTLLLIVCERVRKKFDA